MPIVGTLSSQKSRYSSITIRSTMYICVLHTKSYIKIEIKLRKVSIEIHVLLSTLGGSIFASQGGGDPPCPLI